MSGTSINQHHLTVADHVSRHSSNSDLALHVDLLARHERNSLRTARQGPAVYPLELSRTRRIVSSENSYRLLRSAARTRPSLPSSSRMYPWRSSFRAIWPASASGFILSILHQNTLLCTYIRTLSDLFIILPKRCATQGFCDNKPMYSSSHRRRQKLSRFLIFADETLSRCAVNLVEVLVPERWQQRTQEHRRNNRQEKCQVIPHRKFAPNGDVQRHEHRKHHAADDQRPPAGRSGYPACYGTDHH